MSASFDCNSTTGRKLKDSIKGLVMLHTMLNGDIKELFEHMHQLYGEEFRGLEKCGLANAMRVKKASYKCHVKVQKPGQSKTHSTPKEEEIWDGFADGV